MMNEYALKWNEEVIDEALLNFNNGVKKQAIVQATGTGKSYIIYNIIKHFKEKDKEFKVLYLSPSNNINEQFDSRIPDKWNIHILTYQMLHSLRKGKQLDNPEFLGYDMIILDELHRANAEEWNKSFKELAKRNPKALYLGATATPKRMDQLDTNKDTVDELFDGISVSNLSLAQAINYNILIAPEYYVGVFKIKEQVDDIESKYVSNQDTFIDNEPLREKLREMRAEWEKTTGEKEVFDRVFEGRKDKDYKFIVFCPNKDFIHNNRFTIADNLSISLNCKVKTYEFYTGSGDKGWENFKAAKEGVHLLFVVEMLNEGYHLEGLDGAIMYRGTDSHIIYYQQLGRVLSVSNTKAPIVIDMVNNQAQFSRIRELKEDVERYGREGGWHWNREGRTTAEIQFSVIKPEISILMEELDASMNSIINSAQTKNGDVIIFDEILSKYPKVPLKDLKMWIKGTSSKEAIENSCKAYYQLVVGEQI